ncbi:MAG: LPS export ABC transporter periplasmic protein LptC [Candidatus Kapabacteria bacterium]|nr:LPS export ABC transporter periplasmic protein LptC [Ignavibacteriota bacterium]MCW5884321.1 LPS export ABC transporter periplasmic protein LptC [Candidatus Kapabacteria bacterium]
MLIGYFKSSIFSKFRLSFFVLILCSFVFNFIKIYSQSQTPNEIRLKYADSLIGSMAPGIEFREFYGNVQFEHGDVDVRSDFAKQYEASNKADLIGNVVILQRTLTLKSPKIFYNGNTSVARAVDGVTIKDKETFLKADLGNYNTRTRIAEFQKNVFIEDDSAKIISDFIIHNRNDRKSEAYGNVWIVGQFTNAILKCDTLLNVPSENYSFAIGNPLLMQIDSSFSHIDTTFYGEDSIPIERSVYLFDTLSVKADTMHAYRELFNEKYVFVGNVEIIRGEVRATAKESVFYKDEDYITLSGKPVVWYDSTQLYGDSIVIRMPDNELKGIESYKNAIAVSRNDTVSLKRLDQIMGDKIIIEIDSGKVQGITSIGDAKSLYFFRDEEGESGADRRTTDTIKVQFVEGEAEDIIWLGMTYAEFFPETYVFGKEESHYLPLFQWNDTKPRRPEVIFPYQRFAINPKNF